MCEPKKRRIGKSVPTSFLTCPSVSVDAGIYVNRCVHCALELQDVYEATVIIERSHFEYDSSRCPVSPSLVMLEHDP
ncbi:hypothetical protein PM082_018514 [Marasmius tenuissimus]|nr:hypothetical protein PM082_018514 [Marasmius tenuissimus]